MAGTIRIRIPDSAFAVGGKLEGVPPHRACVSIGNPFFGDSGVLLFTSATSSNPDSSYLGRMLRITPTGLCIDKDLFLSTPPDVRGVLLDHVIHGVIVLEDNGVEMSYADIVQLTP